MQSKIFPVGLLLAVGASPAHALIVDDFRTGPSSLFSDLGTGRVGSNALASDVVGGVRPFELRAISGSASASVGGGSLTWNNDGYSLMDLAYGYRAIPGGFQGNDSTALNLDLTGATGLRFHVSQLTAPVLLYATLMSFENFGYLSNGNPGDPRFWITSAGVVDLPFTALLKPRNSGALQFSNVDFITLNFQMGQTGTMTIDRIEVLGLTPTVPGPLAAAPFVLGALARGRRRRKA